MRCRGDRAATLVEAAIVAPVILLLVFGIIQISFVFRSASITTTAARAGARLGASVYGDATPSTQGATRQSMIDAVEAALDDLRAEATPSRLLIYESDASGNPQSGTTESCGASCVEYRWNASADQFDYYGGGWVDPDNCGDTIDRLGVYVEVDHEASTPLFQSNFEVDEKTVMRLEPGQFAVCTAE
jgi:hypothetical protein